MKKKSVSAGLCGALCLSLLAGCAESPKKDVVTSKNDGVFQQNITVQATAPLDERLTYQDTFTSTDGTVTYTLDLDQELSSQPLPVVEVVPHYLTGEDVERVARAIFGDAEFYEQEPERDPKYSKQQLQEKINRLSSMVTQEDLDEEVENIIKTYIQFYTTQMETAPEENPHAPCDWTFKPDSHYREDSLGDNVIEATVRAGDVEYNLLATLRDRADYKMNQISVQVSDGQSQFEIQYYFSKLCRTPKPTEEQIQAAREKAQGLLDNMGMGQWEVCEAGVQEQTVNGAQEYQILVQAMPVFQVPALSGQRINLTGSNATASNYQTTEAFFYFSANGDLVFFGLNSPVDVKTVVNEEVAILPVEALMEKVKSHLSLTGVEETSEYFVMSSLYQEPMTCQVNLSKVEFGLARMKAPNQDDTYYYSPALKVYGSMNYYSKSTGERLENLIHEDPNFLYDLVWINAVDGSILESS